MTEPTVTLIARAAGAGVRFARTRAGSLEVTGPESARGLISAVRARAESVLKLFDWSHALVLDPASCLLCTRPSFLRDPADRQPAHKVCVDSILRPAA